MSTPLNLSIAIGSYGHTTALKTGAVKIKGVEAEMVEVVPIIAAFRRMVRELAYDVCELAPTTYLAARATGVPIIALPIFLMRRFHHGGFVSREGLSVPKELAGKRVGVRAYTVSTGVWTRGIFQNEYGLDPADVTWVVDDEEHVTTLKLPGNVVHAGKTSLADMMANGELDAAFTGPAGIGRAGPPTSGWESTSKNIGASYPELIPDVDATEAAWFRCTGIYPIHGLIAVKEAVLKDNPWLAQSLLDAFRESKAPYLAALDRGEIKTDDDKRYAALKAVVGADPLPYGYEVNRPAIEAMVQYAGQQKLTPAGLDPKSQFVDI